MDQSNIPLAVTVGQMLRTLRGNRNIADYDLDSVIFETQSNVDLRVDDAKDVIMMIGELEGDRMNVSPILKAKARGLGIHVI